MNRKVKFKLFKEQPIDRIDKRFTSYLILTHAMKRGWLTNREPGHKLNNCISSNKYNKRLFQRAFLF